MSATAIPAPLIESGSNRVKVGRHGAFVYNVNDRYIGRSLDLYGEYCESEARLFGQILHPGETAIDVGANIGALAVPMANAVGPKGRVIALEPQRVLHQMLCANAALNGLTNMVCLNAAASAKEGLVSVPALDYGSANNFGGIALNSNAAQTETVACLTVDALKAPACRLIKIDVEGMELEVLKGAEGTLVRHRPVLHVENDRRPNSAALIQHLLDRSYRLWWHIAPLFEPDNFFGLNEDVFGNLACVNILAVPVEIASNIKGLRPVSGPNDWWRET